MSAELRVAYGNYNQRKVDVGNTGGVSGIPTFIRAQPRLFETEGVTRLF